MLLRLRLEEHPLRSLDLILELVSPAVFLVAFLKWIYSFLDLGLEIGSVNEFLIMY